MMHTKSDGLSLVEVLVAIAMLAIISASVVAFLPTIVNVNRAASSEQRVTATSKRFFERVSGVVSPSMLVEGTYGADETVAGRDVTVPPDCRATVSKPVEDVNIMRIVLSCEDTVDQVLEVGAAS